jgi:hypothetical protein
MSTLTASLAMQKIGGSFLRRIVLLVPSDERRQALTVAPAADHD